MKRSLIRNRNKELLGTIEGDQQEDPSIGEILHEMEMVRHLMTPFVDLLQQLRTKLHDAVFLHNPDAALKHEIYSFLEKDTETAKKIVLLPKETFRSLVR